MKDILSYLNEEQFKAVSATEGATLVLAGAGSGKTRVVTYKAAHLILNKKAPPKSIILVTFTNKAANEMRSRLGELIGPIAKTIHIGTFHKLFLELILKPSSDRPVTQKYGYNQTTRVISEHEARSFIESFWSNLGEEQQRFVARNGISLNEVLACLSRARANGFGSHDYAPPMELTNRERMIDRIMIALWKNLDEEKRKLNAIDADDILYIACHVLKEDAELRDALQYHLKHFIIDEFQDCNYLQFEAIRLLASNSVSITVVGDAKQSIYQFRGSEPSVFQAFLEAYESPSVCVLDTNYRSLNKLVQLSNKLADSMPHRLQEDIAMRAHRSGDGTVQFASPINVVTESNEVAASIQTLLNAGTPPDEIAVLYRENSQRLHIEQALIARRIPYLVNEGVPLLRRRGPRMLLSLCLAPSSSESPLEEKYLEYVLNNSRINLQWRHKKSGKYKDEAIFKYLQFISDADGSLGEKATDIIRDVRLIKKLNHCPPSQAEEQLWEILLRHTYFSREGMESLPAKVVIQQLLDGLKKGVPLEQSAEELLKINSDKTESDKIHLMTIHASKGAEFDTVFLINATQSEHKEREENREEERRVFYVALTRAKSRLHISCPQYNERGLPLQPSPYIAELRRV
ncbi:ATP-dependent helicase [Hahella sp. CR1]|uniref:ATP-dependent helicase n=1 Tax=Hahella sp. CR1 TaxID=2992807 RepID=UPI0024431996|nr:ATP-dependent helicase [Hahella sp. CR1]MDG9671626.1 ATP-dependent helicase [Hahella sp. CR1]